MRAKEFLIEKRRNKKKSKKKIRLSKYFFPGFGYYGSTGSEDSSGMDDGGGGESVKEADKDTNKLKTKEEVKKFVDWACKILHLKNPPKIELSYDTEEAQQGHHTGRHTHGANSVWVYAKNRNLVDILRTVFHELVHVRQGQLGKIKPGSSYPGSPIEAEADMLAGKYIKIYGKANRKIFQ